MLLPEIIRSIMMRCMGIGRVVFHILRLCYLEIFTPGKGVYEAT